MKTIVFDFDGTLTKKSNEIWRKIWIKLDAVEVDDILYEKFNNGEITFKQWTIEIEKEFIKRKFHKSILDELLINIHMMENLKETLCTLKDYGYDLRILSGGIDYVIKNLLKDNINYFSDIRCNHFLFDENGYLTNIIETDSDVEGKSRYIKKLIEDTGCNSSDIIFIGNGNNDRYVSSTGCTTICINPNGTNHLDKNIWHLYVETSTNLLDILDVINNINKQKTSN